MLIPGLPALTGLFTSGKVIKLLPDLLNLVSGGNVKANALKAVNGALDEQAGRSGGKALGRAVCEQIDAVLEADSGLSVEERQKLAQGLANNAALQLAEAAELILAYPPKQAAVVRAKAGSDAAALKQARETRTNAAEAVKGALVDVGRVVAGDAPRGTA
jgi:tellurite resistance protein